MSRTLRIKNKIVLATSTKGYTPITSPKITKKRLSSSRPAVAAGKLGTTTQPYRPTRRKSRVLRTTKTTPQCKIYSAPAVALRIRKESSED